MLAVTPPGPGERCAALLHDGRCHTVPVAEVVGGRPTARGRALPPLGVVVGRGGRRLPWWMPACPSRGPGTSPRPTASCTAGGARPPASAGRRRTASPSTTCPLPRPVTCSSSRRTPRPPRPTRSSTPPGTCAATTRSGCATRPTCRRGRRRRSTPRTSSTTRPRPTSVRLVGTVLSESAAAVLCLELRRDGLPIDRRPHRAAARRRGGPAARHRRRRAGHPARPRRPRAAPRARPGVDRPAQPGPGARAARTPWGSTCRTPASGCSSRTARCNPRRRRPARLAPRRADRHHLRLPLARRARRRRRPAAGAVDGVRRRGRADDRRERPAQPADRAAPRAWPPTTGHVFVRADLGQIEPRVLAVVSGDAAFAAATRADDLYAPVAAAAGGGAAGGQGGRAGRDVRPAQRRRGRGAQGARAGLPGGDGPARAGGRRGASRGAAAHVRRAARSRRGGSSRRARSAPTPRWMPRGGGSRATRSSRGPRPSCSRPGRRRCGRPPVTSGPRWCCACTTSCWCTRPTEHADEVAARVDRALDDAARRWAGGAPVRFVADTSVIARWSDAKD